MSQLRADLGIPVHVQEDLVQDRFGLIGERDETGPPVLVAVLHDGTKCGWHEAERIGEMLRHLLAASPTSVSRTAESSTLSCDT